MKPLRFPDNFTHELELYNKGIKLIAGIDEVGRGPLAGPFVACAVILNLEKLVSFLNRNNDVMSPELELYRKVTDSKKVSEKNRPILADFLKNEAINYSIIEISVETIDRIGMGKVTQVAFSSALKKLSPRPDFVITDMFEIKTLAKESQLNLPQGDLKSITVSAASIIAKLHRDQIMTNEHNNYPIYGFDQHKGYGTKQHIAALMEHGPCQLHRKSFEPVKSLLLKY